MKRVAQVISYVFHPLLLPTYSFALVMYLNPYLFGNYTLHQLGGLLISVFINTFLFPVISILLMYKLNFIGSIYMQTGRERVVPFFGIIIFYLWTYLEFRKSVYPDILDLVLLGACISVMVCFVATLLKKVSLHAMGMGSLIGVIMVLSLYFNYNLLGYLFIAIVLAGIVGSARLVLDAHDNWEIFSGYIIGIGSQLAAYIVKMVIFK